MKIFLGRCSSARFNNYSSVYYFWVAVISNSIRERSPEAYGLFVHLILSCFQWEATCFWSARSLGFEVDTVCLLSARIQRYNQHIKYPGRCHFKRHKRDGGDRVFKHQNDQSMCSQSAPELSIASAIISSACVCVCLVGEEVLSVSFGLVPKKFWSGQFSRNRAWSSTN